MMMDEVSDSSGSNAGSGGGSVDLRVFLLLMGNTAWY